MQLARACYTGGRETGGHCKELLSIPPHVLWYISPRSSTSVSFRVLRTEYQDAKLACLPKNGYQLQPLLRHVQTGLAATFLAQKAPSQGAACRECSPREILPCFVQPPHRCAILEVPLLARLCLCAVRFLTGQFFSALPKLSLPPLLLVFRSSVGQRTFFVNTSARHLP